TTTREPSISGGRRSRTREIAQGRVTDTSATGSRKGRNAGPGPGLGVTWGIWPSTQTPPNRAIHAALLRAAVRTGHGAAGVAAGGGACGVVGGSVIGREPRRSGWTAG